MISTYQHLYNNYTVFIWGGDKVTSTLDDSVGTTEQTEWNQYVIIMI